MPKHLYFFIISFVFSAPVFSQNTTTEIQELVTFFENPNLQVTSQNLQDLDSKAKRLSVLVREKYKALSLMERRSKPESKLLGKWLSKIRTFKQKQHLDLLDTQIANLDKIKSSTDLIELTKLMQKEMKEARSSGKWRGWSKALQSKYHNLLKAGKISSTLKSYYEALD